jgi:hypothetical protein
MVSSGRFTFSERFSENFTDRLESFQTTPRVHLFSLSFESVYMDEHVAKEAYALVSHALGNWWTDERRNWCAYCGIPMRLRHQKGMPVPATKLTRDHIIPKKHKGGGLTIPACRGCNEAKSTLSLQEFLLTNYFLERRKRRHKNQWPTRTLWLVLAAAALKNAI